MSQLKIVDGDIVGKYVTKLAGVGTLMDFLGSPTGFLLVIVLPLLLFFAYQLYHLIMISVNLRKATVVEAAQAAARTKTNDTERLKADAERARAEAQAALEEAKRLREEAEAQLARARNEKGE